MQVKDQIKIRREQLEISLPELAKRLQCTEQAIRHWESGRSLPNKRKAADIEAALSFTIDWTEGARKDKSALPDILSLISQPDIDLLVLICKLPPSAKALFGELVRAHLAAMGREEFATDKRIMPVVVEAPRRKPKAAAKVALKRGIKTA